MTELTIEEATALAPAVTPEEAAKKVSAGAVLIDVRSEAGRASTGSVPGATVVGKDQIEQDWADHVPQVDSTDTPIVVVCGSVRGSGPVAAQLIDRGYTNVVHVEGGFPAWKDAGLPTDPPTGSS